MRAVQAEAPIIVVSGLPRSGTSLMMQMLEAAGVPILDDGQREEDDSNPNGYYELEAVKATAHDAAWVEEAPGHAVKVIHALLPHLPAHHHYQVLLMQRDAHEVVASQNRMLENDASSDPGMSDARLVEVFNQQMEKTTRLLGEENHFEWTTVRHADLFGDDELSIRRICRFLGLPGSVKKMRARIDPSLYRARATAPKAPRKA